MIGPQDHQWQLPELGMALRIICWRLSEIILFSLSSFGKRWDSLNVCYQSIDQWINQSKYSETAKIELRNGKCLGESRTGVNVFLRRLDHDLND